MSAIFNTRAGDGSSSPSLVHRREPPPPLPPPGVMREFCALLSTPAVTGAAPAPTRPGIFCVPVRFVAPDLHSLRAQSGRSVGMPSPRREGAGTLLWTCPLHVLDATPRSVWRGGSKQRYMHRSVTELGDRLWCTKKRPVKINALPEPRPHADRNNRCHTANTDGASALRGVSAYLSAFAPVPNYTAWWRTQRGARKLPKVFYTGDGARVGSRTRVNVNASPTPLPVPLRHHVSCLML